MVERERIQDGITVETTRGGVCNRGINGKTRVLNCRDGGGAGA